MQRGQSQISWEAGQTELQEAEPDKLVLEGGPAVETVPLEEEERRN